MEDPVSVPVTSEMICSSAQYLTTGTATQIRYKPHKLFYYQDEQLLEWPIQTDKKLTCWHCISKVCSDNAIPMPQSYDERTGKYTVAGVFCSFGCAKRYTFERYNSNTTILLMYLCQMAREIYSFQKPIVPAPPQSSLDRFGGPLSIEEFRIFVESEVLPQVELHQPPFVSHVMIYNTGHMDAQETEPTVPKKSQVEMAASAAASVLVDDNPQLKRPSLFENYLKKRSGDTPALPDTTQISSKPKKQKRGNLSAYFKSKD